MGASWERTLSDMLSIEPASAVVARVPVPPALERLRRRWDWAARVGVPAHVTILFPFVPADGLDPEVRRTLASIAARHDPFVVRFARVGRFPSVVYLRPEPVAAFTRRTEAVAECFPAYPPYGGAFDEVIPHLTITESGDAPFEEISRQAERPLPFEHRITALEVLIEGADGRWGRRWRIPLDFRP